MAARLDGMNAGMATKGRRNDGVTTTADGAGGERRWGLSAATQFHCRTI
jgi:hypothetical protein